MNPRSKLPVVTAIIIFSLLLLAAQPALELPRASNTWWLSMTEAEQGFYLIGYLTASWTWAQGLFQASRIEPLNEPVAYIYNKLAPAASYSWHELDTAITNFYSSPTTDHTTPVWRVLHEYATQFKTPEGEL